MKFLLNLLLLPLLISCGTPNLPIEAEAFQTKPGEGKVYVDSMGRNIAPSWVTDYGLPGSFGGYSLERQAVAAGKLSLLEKQTSESLKNFEDLTRDKKRVIFLIHGYNAAWKKTNVIYDDLVSNLVLTQDDVVIRFFWDGLVARGLPLFGDARIWWYACGNSHLAGTKGLRPLLDRLEGKEVVFISHSRGTHVVLTALSNASVDPRFVEKTDDVMCRKMFKDEELKDRGNTIRALFLAPAVGRVDFLEPGTDNFRPFRSLGTQVQKIVHTVNSGDKTLKKHYSRFSDNFNATNFGYNSVVADQLRKSKHYSGLESVTVRNLPTHSFALYIRNKEVVESYSRVGLKIKQDPAKSTPPSSAGD